MTRVPALVLLAAVSAPRLAWAGGGAATDSYEGIQEGALDVHGLLDVYAQHDFQEPSRGEVRYRAFDGRNGLSLGLLRLTLAHAPGVVGFRVDAGVGDLPDAYMDSDPDATLNPELARVLSYVEQAFVTVRPPPVPGLAIDGGKFGTPVGLEDNESIYNWNYSRSLLFTQAEPTYHTGLRATYGQSEGLAFTAFWLNGWNTNVLGGNGMRSFAAAATWRGRGAVPPQVALVYAAGLERAPMELSNPALSFRHEFDAYASTVVRQRLELAASVDYGTDASRGGVSWWGLSGALRYRVTPWLAVAVRGEHLSDSDGFLTGTVQQLAGLTGTLQVKRRVGPFEVLGWLEYRRDRSDTPVFPSHATQPVLHQDTLTLAGAAAF